MLGYRTTSRFGGHHLIKRLQVSAVFHAEVKNISSSSMSVSTDVEMISANNRFDRGSFLHGSTHNNGTRSYTSTSPSYDAAAAVATNHTSTDTTTTTTSSSDMKDEYGAMDSAGHSYVYEGDFLLESGASLPEATLRYQTYGILNEERSNCIVVCHALTGNASLHAWWGDLLGPGRAFDTSKYFVVCCNILGSCYGSTNPTSINPKTGEPYCQDFPDVSVKDTVRFQLDLLRDELEISSIKAVIGGSFGGMQAVEFAAQAGVSASDGGRVTDVSGKPYIQSVVPIACGAQHTAWQIAVSEVQRQAIHRDAQWMLNPMQATDGLQVARQLGMISYRTPGGYSKKFGRQVKESSNENTTQYGSKAQWQVKNYLEYQGRKFLDRFDPVTYVKLTEQMDSHDVYRGQPKDILQRVKIPSLVLGISSDVLYPLHEQEELAADLGNSTLEVINSPDGHDGFLLEQDQVSDHISNFLGRID